MNFKSVEIVYNFNFYLYYIYDVCLWFLGMEADEKLFNKLIEGYRMDQPKYATNEV